MAGAAAGIGAGLGVLGAVMQMVAAKKAEAEMAQTFQKEQDLQNRYQVQAFGNHQQLVPTQGVETARQDLAAGKERRVGEYNRLNENRLGGGPANARDQQAFALSGNARANLGSYSDWQLNNAIRRIRSADRLNRIVFNASEDAGVFPYRMFDAQHSADDLAALGQLAASAGGATTAFGSLYGAQPKGGLTDGANGAQYGGPGYDFNNGYSGQFGGQV